MDKLSYCLDCQRIFSSSGECTYCNSQSVKNLDKRAPVNIIGTKLKGRVLKITEGMVQVLFEGDKKVKSIKEFETSKIRKIL